MYGQVVMVIDEASQEPALERFRAACEVAAVSASCSLHWEPYTKLGPHVMVWAAIRLAAGDSDPDAVCTEVDRICADLAVLPAGYDPEQDRYGRILIRYVGGSYAYERILDHRATPFKVKGLIWLHVAVHADPISQERYRATF